jgi:hypothetical protein
MLSGKNGLLALLGIVTELLSSSADTRRPSGNKNKKPQDFNNKDCCFATRTIHLAAMVLHYSLPIRPICKEEMNRNTGHKRRRRTNGKCTRRGGSAYTDTVVGMV